MNVESNQKGNTIKPRLDWLLDRLCDAHILDGDNSSSPEASLSPEEVQELETLVLQSPESKTHYLNCIMLHGSLHWNKGILASNIGVAGAKAVMETEKDEVDSSLLVDANALLSDHAIPAIPASSKNSNSHAALRTLIKRTLTGIALLFAIIVGGSFAWNSINPATPTDPEIVHVSPSDNNIEPTVIKTPNGHSNSHSNTPNTTDPTKPLPFPIDKHALNNTENTLVKDNENPSNKKGMTPSKNVDGTTPNNTLPNNKDTPVVGKTNRIKTNHIQAPRITSKEIVNQLDLLLSQSWVDAEVQPSPRADDQEWVRRVYLDTIGRIPTATEADHFLQDTAADKRIRLAKSLLQSHQFAKHTASRWSRLLVGLSQQKTDLREPLRNYLATSFQENRPWDNIVQDLITAEGTPQENGATGFLLAHLNNDAVPATAVTARLLMGVQIQCVQCHAHPFNKREQKEFWEFNSFFQDIKTTWVKQGDKRVPSLGAIPSSDPVFYETRAGIMKVAFPRFGTEKIDVSEPIDRRFQLSQLMQADHDKLMAKSFVNRSWARFFGYGFTSPIDDLGSHNRSHLPEVMNYLTENFIASGYDTQALMEWIILSDAYQRSSTITKHNTVDRPDLGEAPLFSRVYVKPMSPEQIYNSLRLLDQKSSAKRITQIGKQKSGNQKSGQQKAWRTFARNRDRWVQQFVVSLETEENTEDNLFDGSIRQSLELMNGKLVDTAVKHSPLLVKNLPKERGDSLTPKINRLSLATLSRYPTAREIKAFRSIMRKSKLPPDEGLKNIFWAYLNSNEFMLVH